MSVGERKESYQLVLKEYVLVPPDGGWGYLVAIGAIINLSTTTAFAACFGMLFNEFIISVGMSSAEVTLLSGIVCMSIATAAFFTSPLLAIMSTRKLAFTAAVVFSLGAFGTVVMTSQFLFYISQGIMQGAGLGTLYNLSCTVVNDYFLDRRMLIMSFVQTAVGFVTMLAPMFVKWAIDEYGSRGCLLLIAGLSLNNLFAALIMQPVRWHMKKVEVPEKAEQHQLLEEKSDVKKFDTPVLEFTDLEGKVTKLNVETHENKSGLRKVLESFLDTSLFKTFLLSCALFGPATCSTADGIYVVMLPQYLYSLAWTQDTVAMAISLYGFGDLAMRVVLMFMSKWLYKLGVQEIYIIGIALAIISRLGMLCTYDVTALMVSFTLMGVAHCCVAVLLPLVISEAVEPEKFTSAMGLCLLFVGILSITLSPAVGAVRDFTNSYSTAFYTVTSFYVIIFVIWPMELFAKKNKQMRQLNKITKSSQLNKVPE